MVQRQHGGEIKLENLAILLITVILVGAYVSLDSQLFSGFEFDDFGQYVGLKPINILSVEGSNPYWQFQSNVDRNRMDVSLPFYDGRYIIENGRLTTSNLFGKEVRLTPIFELEDQFTFCNSCNPIVPSGSIKINGKIIYEARQGTFTPFIEIVPSALNQRLILVKVDGVESARLSLPSNNLFVEIEVVPGICRLCQSFESKSGRLVLDSSSIKVKTLFDACSQDNSRRLIFESFVGGQSISESSFRYAPVQYCSDHPIIITDEKKQGSIATSEPYTALSRGESIEIPTTQTWSVFYLAYNDGSIPELCGDAYDPTQNKCINTTGIAIICSEGTFDPLLGSCVVTPGIKEVCTRGRFDTTLNACIYNPPLQAICQKGEYNSITELCEFIPETENICSEGTYDPLKDVCEVEPISILDVDCDGKYDEETNTCKIEPLTQVECVRGEYNETLDKCIYIPEESITDMFKITIKPLIIAGILLVILIVIISKKS